MMNLNTRCAEQPSVHDVLAQKSVNDVVALNNKAIKDVKKKHDAITKETPPLLHVESNDPIYKAVRYLLRLAKEDPRNPDRG